MNKGYYYLIECKITVIHDDQVLSNYMNWAYSVVIEHWLGEIGFGEERRAVPVTR